MWLSEVLVLVVMMYFGVMFGYVSTFSIRTGKVSQGSSLSTAVETKTSNNSPPSGKNILEPLSATLNGSRPVLRNVLDPLPESSDSAEAVATLFRGLDNSDTMESLFKSLDNSDVLEKLSTALNGSEFQGDEPLTDSRGGQPHIVKRSVDGSETNDSLSTTTSGPDVGQSTKPPEQSNSSSANLPPDITNTEHTTQQSSTGQPGPTDNPVFAMVESTSGPTDTNTSTTLLITASVQTNITEQSSTGISGPSETTVDTWAESMLNPPDASTTVDSSLQRPDDTELDLQWLEGDPTFKFINWSIDAITVIPRDVLVGSIWAAERVRLSDAAKVQIWSRIKGEIPISEVNVDMLKSLRSLIYNVPEADLFELNMTDWEVVSYLGGLPGFPRRKLGVLGYALQKAWGEDVFSAARLINAYGNLLCGFPSMTLVTLSPKTMTELKETMFSESYGCTPRQMRKLLEVALEPLGYGPVEMWGAKQLRHLGLLITQMTPAEMRQVRPAAMVGIEPAVLNRFSNRQLAIFSERQVAMLTEQATGTYRWRLGIKSGTVAAALGSRTGVLVVATTVLFGL